MYLFMFGHEKCVPSKRTVRLIYSYNAVHYVVNGQGFFNGINSAAAADSYAAPETRSNTVRIPLIHGNTIGYA